MNIEEMKKEFKNLNHNVSISNLEIELDEIMDRPNRYNVVVNLTDIKGDSKKFLIGTVEKNYFQPMQSELISAELVTYFEDKFQDLWELAKSHHPDLLDQRWNYITTQINETLKQ
jgi:hypothetical protein